MEIRASVFFETRSKVKKAFKFGAMEDISFFCSTLLASHEDVGTTLQSAESPQLKGGYLEVILGGLKGVLKIT